MTDNELLLAISNLLDKKLKAEMEPINSKIDKILAEQARINIIIENELRSDIKLLAENYLPSAERYEKETAKIEAIQNDVDIMKKVVTEHSEKIQKIS